MNFENWQRGWEQVAGGGSLEGCCVQQPLQALCLPSQSCKKVNIGYEIASRHRIGIVKPDIFEAFYSSPSSFPINTSNELLPPLYHPSNHIQRICRFQWFQNMPALLEIFIIQRQKIGFVKVVRPLRVKHVTLVIDSIVWLLGTYVRKGCAATF